MKTVTFYNEAGKITGICSCATDEALQETINANDSFYLYGEYNPDQFYVVNGNPVNFPEKPSDDYSWDWDNYAWVIDVAKLTQQAIYKRNLLLKNSDWTMLPDAPTDKNAWAIYRQHLRDIPQQAEFPNVIDWGIAPNA